MSSVVLTGAQGPVAEAVQRRLRRLGLDVKAFNRGADVAEAIREADVVVVMDAARTAGSVADYAMALRAVSQATGRSPTRRVIAVTMLPPHRKRRTAFVKRAEKVESQARATGVPLTVIRAGVVVGTPDHEGPADNAVIADGRWLWVPGDGTAEVRPVLVEDLASLVATAIGGPARATNEVVRAEGPETLTVDGMLRCINGNDARLVHFWTGLPSLVATFVVVTWPAVFFVRRMMRAPAVIPSDDFEVGGATGPEALGVTTASLGTAWTSRAREERKIRKGDAKSLRHYQAASGSRASAALLIGAGVLALIVGAHDVVSISTLGARLGGAALIAASVLMIAGGAGLLTLGWSGRYRMAFLGAASLVATLTGLILAALVNRDPPAWTVVWVYLLVFAVVVLVRLWTFGGLGLATLLKQRGLQAAGAVFAVGVVGAVVQFLYSSVYVPATATPALAVETKFKASKPEAGRVPVTATVTFTNTTKHPVNVLGTMYTIYGAKMEPHDLDDKSVQDGEELLRRPAHLRAGRARVYARDGTWRAIEGGTVFPAGTFAEPGERLSDQLVAFVPRDMDVASLLVEAVVARRRFQDLDEERTSIVEDRDGSVIHRSLRIKDPSWLHSLTRRTRYVNVLQAFRNEPLPGCAGRYLAVFIASEPWAPTLLGEEGCGSHAAHMRDHYGITPLSARTEIRLEG